jgi:NitT/TauT family transport system ATP-binding protein
MTSLELSMQNQPMQQDVGNPSRVSAPEVNCRDLAVEFSQQNPSSLPWGGFPKNNTRRILDNLQMNVAGGEIVGLIGASGCGKSTLLRTVAGLQQPTSGSVTIAGKPINDCRDQLSFVFQEAALLPWRSVIENVQLPWELQGVGGRQEAKARAAELLRTVGLQDADHRKLPAQLSGGMKMRASLARSLVLDPSVLLLDEPFAALDDMLRWRLNALVLDLWKARRRTILFVTHNIAEAVFLSNRIAIMHAGKIAEWIDVQIAGPRDESLRSSVEFAAMYGKVSARLSAIAQ